MLKCILESNFVMKDNGIVDVILGIRILRTPRGLAFPQSHYIEKIHDKFKYLNFNIVNVI